MTEARSSRAQRVLVVLGIVVLAFNLRPAAVSVGPVLGDISAGLRMSTAETGILTSLPVLAFAVFGALAPRGARLVGLHRLTLLALLCVVGGLAGRGVTSSVPLFLAALPPGARRDGLGQRAAALAGQAALPQPDRADDRGLLDRAGDRPHLRVGADRPDRRGAGRLAVGPDGLGGHRGHRRTPLARARRARPPAGGGQGPHRAAGRGPHPARLADGAVLRAAVAAGVRRSSAGSPSSTATPGSPRTPPACCSG